MSNLNALEVEEVVIKNNRIVSKNAPTPTETKKGGKSRFSHMAFKVLAQILDEKDEKGNADGQQHRQKSRKDEKHDHDEAEKSAAISPVLTARTLKVEGESSLRRFTSKTSLSGSSQSLVKEPRPPRRSKFMSLVRLATLKRKMARNRRKTSPKPIQEAEPPEPIPTIPRFSALLSTEGQYAMIKGYEDVILNEMKSMQSHTNATNSFLRVKSPEPEVLAIKPSNVTLPNTLSQSRNSLMASQTSLSSVSLNSSLARSSTRSGRSSTNR